MISAIRTYIDNAILAVDPELKFIDDPFGDDDVSDSVADSYYKLYFGAASFERTGNSYVENIPLFIEVFAGRRRDKTAAFDEVYEKALCIKSEVEFPKSDKQNDNFTEIIALSLVPEPLDNSDNTIKVIMEYTIRRDFSYI